MKKLVLISALVLASFAAKAQNNVMVLETERIFKSIPAYTTALSELDALANTYQKRIDEQYAQIERMYNEYQTQKAALSEATRRTREDAIIAKEKEVAKQQEDIFGAEGTIIKTRIQKMKPIQDKVFAAVEKYAAANGFSLVIDLSSNSSVIYSSPASNKTDEIIKLLASVKF